MLFFCCLFCTLYYLLWVVLLPSCPGHLVKEAWSECVVCLFLMRLNKSGTKLCHSYGCHIYTHFHNHKTLILGASSHCLTSHNLNDDYRCSQLRGFLFQVCKQPLVVNMPTTGSFCMFSKHFSKNQKKKKNEIFKR